MKLGVNPLGNRVLLEQIMVKKDTKVILPGKQQDESQFDIYFRVAALGEKVPEDSKLKVGDVPVLAKYVDLGTMKVIHKSDKKGMYALIVVHYDEIAATEDPDDKNQFPENWKKKLGIES